jgi:hypothetical protein
MCPPVVDGAKASTVELSNNAWEDTSFRGPELFSARSVPRADNRLQLVKDQCEKARKEVDVKALISAKELESMQYAMSNSS